MAVLPSIPDALEVILLTLGAGITMGIGAALASVEHLRSEWLEEELRHGVIAFGGGALLAAVALVLIPEGLQELTLLPACLAFIGGALAFMALDVFLARRGTPASQLVAMLSDFLPESLALGALVASGSTAAPLLALIIALQNLPEGFNSFRELGHSTHYSSRLLIFLFFIASLAGPVCGLIGFYLLSDLHTVIASVMLFASGGILYLIFQDIAPQARLERHWAPPLGAVLGFLLGLIGKVISGA
ncbi:zinc/iron permease [Luminiphilus syltensis NOR5-1B]|uniref:Zinc/iron permease n=1 Tax=Luminiphilus syltensis NOR5-1B TaxID=565045 RepID=B8KX57_9GAMM|nr:divalent cation transporter [Luminiphilus syltensis]EED36659.1 zinc/iron permease [Luminiphilus syltensis NOR5-1B]